MGRAHIIEKPASLGRLAALPQTPCCNYNRFSIFFSFIKLNLLPQNGHCLKCLDKSLPIQVCRGAYIPYFKINAPIFQCSLFFEEYLHPQVRINKMGNKHTVNYHPSPSQLTSRIQPLIFLQTLKGVYLSIIFLEFFLKPVYPIVDVEKFPPLPFLNLKFKFHST